MRQRAKVKGGVRDSGETLLIFELNQPIQLPVPSTMTPVCWLDWIQLYYHCAEFRYKGAMRGNERQYQLLELSSANIQHLRH